MSNHVRAQFLRGRTLVAEVIVESFSIARELTYDFHDLKHKRGLPGCDCLIQLASKPRVMDIPVGTSYDNN